MVSTDKASSQLNIRIPDELKRSLQEVLSNDPNYRGNISEFVLDCIKARVMLGRRSERPSYPVDFVAISEASITSAEIKKPKLKTRK